MSRKRAVVEDVFATATMPTHIFRAADVTSILGMEKWRLEKYLAGKQYRISPAGHIGEGTGSWRLFSHGDIYRLGIADRMVKDGFTAKLVSLVLQEIEDRDLLTLDPTGEPDPPDLGIFRTSHEPELRFVSDESTGQKNGPYYVIRLRDLLQKIDREIFKRMKERQT